MVVFFPAPSTTLVSFRFLRNLEYRLRPCTSTIPLLGRWNSTNSRWNKRISILRAFKLDHLQPIQPILFWKFSIITTFILGSHFLLPLRVTNGKVVFIQLQNVIRQVDFNAPGIQTGPFTAHFVHRISIFCAFILRYAKNELCTPNRRCWIWHAFEIGATFPSFA